MACIHHRVSTPTRVCYVYAGGSPMDSACLCMEMLCDERMKRRRDVPQLYVATGNGHAHHVRVRNLFARVGVVAGP